MDIADISMIPAHIWDYIIKIANLDESQLIALFDEYNLSIFPSLKLTKKYKELIEKIKYNEEYNEKIKNIEPILIPADIWNIILDFAKLDIYQTISLFSKYNVLMFPGLKKVKQYDKLLENIKKYEEVCKFIFQIAVCDVDVIMKLICDGDIPTRQIIADTIYQTDFHKDCQFLGLRTKIESHNVKFEHRMFDPKASSNCYNKDLYVHSARMTNLQYELGSRVKKENLRFIDTFGANLYWTTHEQKLQTHTERMLITYQKAWLYGNTKKGSLLDRIYEANVLYNQEVIRKWKFLMMWYKGTKMDPSHILYPYMWAIVKIDSNPVTSTQFREQRYLYNYAYDFITTYAKTHKITESLIEKREEYEQYLIDKFVKDKYEDDLRKQGIKRQNNNNNNNNGGYGFNNFNNNFISNNNFNNNNNNNNNFITSDGNNKYYMTNEEEELAQALEQIREMEQKENEEKKIQQDWQEEIQNNYKENNSPPKEKNNWDDFEEIDLRSSSNEDTEDEEEEEEEEEECERYSLKVPNSEDYNGSDLEDDFEYI